MLGSYEHPALSLAKILVDPVLIFLSLVLAASIESQAFDGFYLLLGGVAFILAGQVFDGFDFFDMSHPRGWGIVSHGRKLMLAWGAVLLILATIGWLSGIVDEFNPRVLLLWSLLTPILLFAGHSMVHAYLDMLRRRGNIRRSIIVGANDLGLRLAERIYQKPSLMTRVEGFFDDRQDDRTDLKLRHVIFGGIDDVPAYVASHGIDLVYITLPLFNQGRVIDLVNSLRDTTASIYFVPDVFIFDLVQARLDNLNGVPVISVFETPLGGINAILKRMFDIVVAGMILVAISPLLIVIALLVKLSSRGPVIFKQRRYGMYGEEILVFKFRSMAVCEDGQTIAQATRNDARVTPLGAILRRTSLDELPQFFNVLQGSMSIVGPRPHAVAHNEHYRKLIHGYMWRHKVKPGITGWAQVNGYRGETDTIDKMEGRVLYDIAYLKNWSLWLDIVIILRTVRLVLKDTQAY